MLSQFYSFLSIPSPLQGTLYHPVPQMASTWMISFYLQHSCTSHLCWENTEILNKVHTPQGMALDPSQSFLCDPSPICSQPASDLLAFPLSHQNPLLCHCPELLPCLVNSYSCSSPICLISHYLTIFLVSAGKSSPPAPPPPPAKMTPYPSLSVQQTG